MIVEITQHLVDRIVSVSALAGSTGISLGGTEADPTLTSIPAPAAWVVFEGAQDMTRTDGKSGADSRYQKLNLTYSVVLVLDYGNGETDLKNQLKLIEDVATAVRGTSPSQLVDPISYLGCTLLSVKPDRIAYALTFGCIAYYTT
jgi:phage gp37-like protein